MKSNRCVKIGLFMIAMLIGLTGALRAQESSTFPAAERDRLYKMTYDAKKRVDDAQDYAFVEGVPILAKVKTVSPECQSLSSLALHAYAKNGALVFRMVSSEASRQRTERPELSSVSAVQFQTAIKEVSGRWAAGLSQSVPHTHNSKPNGHHHEVPSAAHALVPDIERLATVAGYEDVSHEITPGIAACLDISERAKKNGMRSSIEGFCKRYDLVADVHYQEKPSWARLRAGLRQGYAFSVTNKQGQHFLVLGYSETRDKQRVLFAFDPTLVERGVYFLGREMPESRLSAARAKSPNLSHIAPRYFDIMSSHKQYQHRGFCAMDYESIVSMSFIDNVRIDETAIRSNVSNAFDAALKQVDK